MIIDTIELTGNIIIVRYMYDGIWCKAPFSFKDYIKFTMHTNPTFDTVIAMAKRKIDTEYMIDYINHVFFKPEWHAYAIESEHNTFIMNLFETLLE